MEDNGKMQLANPSGIRVFVTKSGSMTKERFPVFCQHFVDTGERPANFIRDSDVQQRFDEYPRLKELIAAKDKRIADRAAPST